MPDYAEAGFAVLPLGFAELRQALSTQYGLLPVETEHAMANLDNSYPVESVLKVHGTGREIRRPAHPAECRYVRVVVDGLEIARWIDTDMALDPAGVMGALLGTAMGGHGS